MLPASEGVGTIRWWVGFTKLPIPDDEARGVSVLSRGKLVQAPFYFDLSGGAHGQHGMQYLTGEVQADSLDEAVDQIATDPTHPSSGKTLAPSAPRLGPEEDQGAALEWASARQRENGDTSVTRPRTSIGSRNSLSASARSCGRDHEVGVDRRTIDDARLDELVSVLFKAYENETFMQLIRASARRRRIARRNSCGCSRKWDVLEAISVAQTVRGRIEVIRKFRALIKAKAPEKPDMQDFVRARPWLMNPQWDVLQHERSLDKVLAEHFGVEGDADYDGNVGSKAP